MSEKSVEWIILVTDKYEESLTFYRDVLGFAIEREMAAEHFCQFQLANCFLAIYGRAEMDVLLGPGVIKQPGGAIYTFPRTDNVDQEYQNLEAKGVKFIKAPQTQPWGQRTAYFTDPDGHIWEIQQWLETK